MNEFGYTCNNQELKAASLPTEAVTICGKANDLLHALMRIESLVVHIDDILFCAECMQSAEKEAPNCLATNVDLACETAKVITARLEKIINRL
jgi:hypothetical protein